MKVWGQIVRLKMSTLVPRLVEGEGDVNEAGKRLGASNEKVEPTESRRMFTDGTKSETRLSGCLGSRG